MIKKIFIFIFISFLNLAAFAQELNCNVEIDGTNAQLTAADKSLIVELKTAITNFMNNRKWTNDVFNPEEKIKCNIFITVTSVPSYGSFQATASVQASRPVYQSMYESTLINYFDKKFNFDYNPSQPLDFNENTYFSNLTSMLAFYAYIILALDYDSFSKFGGTPYLEKARTVVNVAQSYQDAWTQGESNNNRYWLMDNLNHQQMIPLREAYYSYHRLGLDKFLINAEESRKEIYEAIKKIKQPLQTIPASILIKTFFVTKNAELVKIFTGAEPELKKNAVELLSQLDPLNSPKYSTILK